jgi:hypothetical protein
VVSHVTLVKLREAKGGAHPTANHNQIVNQIKPRTPELAQIFEEEKHHFTKSKLTYTLVAFLSVFTLQLLDHTTDLLSDSATALVVYSVYAATVVA